MTGPVIPSLAQIYSDYFLIGCIFNAKNMEDERFGLIRRQFNCLTADNAMKPISLQTSPGVFSYQAIDGMIETVKKAGIAVHGHTLAWHQQSPPWLNTDEQGQPLGREQAEENLTAYVKNAAGHFRGRVVSWDVLNEAIRDNPPNPPDWRNCMRPCPWLNAFGNGAGASRHASDYVEMLFRTAREADPRAKLYYNDYNLNDHKKASAVIAMVSELNEKYLAEGHDRLLIEGVGMQGHYNLATRPEDVEASIRRFIELGVAISISELDITVSGVLPGGMTGSQEERQAALYARLFEIFKRYAEYIERVTFWGLDDGTSWRAFQFPVLFHADLSPKQALYAVADPEGYLADHPDTETVGNMRGVARYGKPAIGGETDPLWRTAPALPVNQMLQAWQTATGTARVLWDETHLYVSVDVKDPVLDGSALKDQERDSVEVYVYEARQRLEMMRYRVGFDNRVSWEPAPEGFLSATKRTPEGYRVEMKLPLKSRFEPAKFVGFDVRINDARDGARTGVAAWNDTSADPWQDATRWGEIVMLEAEARPDHSPEEG